MSNVEKIVEGIKVNADMQDLLLAGVTKYFEEKFMAQYVGNGNYLSGVVKLASGLAVNKMISGRVAKILKIALVLDGVEDIVVATVNKFNGSGEQNNSMVI